MYTIEELIKERGMLMNTLKWCEDKHKEIEILIAIDSIDQEILKQIKESKDEHS